MDNNQPIMRHKVTTAFCSLFFRKKSCHHSKSISYQLKSIFLNYTTSKIMQFWRGIKLLQNMQNKTLSKMVIKMHFFLNYQSQLHFYGKSSRGRFQYKFTIHKSHWVWFHSRDEVTWLYWKLRTHFCNATHYISMPA